jgi:hypothetical protein
MKKLLFVLLLLPLATVAQTKSYIYLNDGAGKDIFEGFEITIKWKGEKIVAVESFTMYGKGLKDIVLKEKKINNSDDDVSVSFKANGGIEYYFTWTDDDKDKIRLYSDKSNSYWNMKLEKETEVEDKPVQKTAPGKKRAVTKQ